MKAAIISCAFNEKEQRLYDQKENALTGKLLSPAEAHRKPKWLLSTQRKLLMLTTWINLPEIDEGVDLKATNMKTTFDEKDFFLAWFEAQGQKPDLNDPAPLLQILLGGAPKVRALLRNVRSQVRFYSISMSVQQVRCGSLLQRPMY